MIIAKQSILRLFQYREFLVRAKIIGMKKIYSDYLAEASGTSSTQVRKDFSLFGISGNKKAGYQLNDLLDQLNELLGKNMTQKIIIVGAGNIGHALMNYEGFFNDGIEIVAIFDNDGKKHDPNGKPPILPVENLYEFIQKNSIEIGIIAVPYHSAQQVLDLMILSGIKGVMNFAPISLKALKDFYINYMNLRLELESVGYFINVQKRKISDDRQV